MWLEGNPLAAETVEALLQALPASTVTALGLDEGQLAQLAAPRREELVSAAGPKLRVSRIVPPPSGAAGQAHGYFKLDPAPAADAAGAAGAAPSAAAEVLVVSFGSAPGTPNWGGLLKKARAAAVDPREQGFDVLYVVDPHRSWYRGEPASLCWGRGPQV